MCGIIGRTGKNNAVPYLLDGLGKLEYRGYDSAGIAVMNDGKITACKACGRLDNLKQMVSTVKLDSFTGIGHTRWATHGEPSEKNAHPHFSADGKFAIVHNGIIENYAELAKGLAEKPVSQTDTEIIALLLQENYNGDPVKAIAQTQLQLHGSYALGILCEDFPDTVFCTAKASPLVVAAGKDGSFIASDVSALAEYSAQAYAVSDGEMCVLTNDSLLFCDAQGKPIEKEPFEIQADAVSSGKQGYEHYMLLEIMQQPEAVRNTLLPLIKNGQICLDNLSFDESFIRDKLNKAVIVACGSAYHTGLVGKWIIESLCRVQCSAEIASEFRYADPLIDENTLCVFISQSGETADTLAALRLAKERRAKVLSIVNVAGSAIAKESDSVIYTKAGREIAVATTKAYSAQLAVLYALTIYIAQCREKLSKAEGASFVHELTGLPDKIQEALEKTADKAKELSNELAECEDMYFIGRQLDYAAAMEGSLKMKEISYIHSEAYAAGELKHGTISLIAPGTPVIALAGESDVLLKTVSNVREVQARGAKTTVISTMKNAPSVSGFGNAIFVPDTVAEFAVSLLIIPLQLLSYYTAKKRGCDIDKPKNLAKSVTVE